MTGPAKINHLSTKNHRILAYLQYHNLITIYTIALNSLSLLHNLMNFLCSLRKTDSKFGMKDISKTITRCDLHSDGRFS